MGYEIAEPRKEGPHRGGTWKVPDVIIYPTGGGTGILGIWKAFDELEQMGMIGSKRPRIISIQSKSTAPIVEAFKKGERDSVTVTPGETLATGLNVPGGVGHFRVLEIIYESEGCALGISEDEMKETLRTVYRTKQWWISPEGAACIAALPHLVDMGYIKAGDHVVTFNTGSMEKYLPSLRSLL